MIVIAHRGASAYYKENTIPAFKSAFDMGAKFMETDIQRSKDGALILYHDYNLPDGKPIKDCDFIYLKRFEVPSVKNLFDIAKNPEININLEIKNDGNLYPGIEKQLFDFLNSVPEVHKDRLLISSFDFQTLKRVRALDPSIKIGVLTRDFDIDLFLSIKPYSIHMSYKRINAEIVKICKENNLKTFIYTVNDYKLALQMQQLGVSGIFSDYPDILSLK